MSIVDQVGGSVGAFAWQGLGGALFIFIIFFFVLALVGGVTFFLWWKSYNLKVTIYKPLGQIKFTPEEITQMLSDQAAGIHNEKLKQIKFDYLGRKTTHGKDITQRGTSYFALFMPLKKIKPIPISLRFHEGIHVLQLSKDIFIPFAKPNFFITIYENVSISVAENQEWISWSNMQADRINAKYQNPDAEKKQVLYFVIGIAAMVIIGGFILWLIYSSAKKGMDVKGLAEAITNSVKTQSPIGVPK
jgi:hypothetical protein